METIKYEGGDIDLLVGCECIAIVKDKLYRRTRGLITIRYGEPVFRDRNGKCYSSDQIIWVKY